ncbi:hypothetical protein GCM10007874_27560 [Labrys miyagiensis]|uniref:Cytochrome c domain-containing protein n=2 Tax=Labrys miyagiensis TaxID=346912 RepID=A0ABQ6CLZ9_9HYPH|nr:hypothetical protein GCM10007874_27560 [Labrys miyagiensis]
MGEGRDMPPLRIAGTVLFLFFWLAATLPAAMAEPVDFPSASIQPLSRASPGIRPDAVDPNAPLDEAQGGMTEAGTPVGKRGEGCFPAEQRNVFENVDMIAGPNGVPQPFSYVEHGAISEEAHNAIRGKNTWMLWGEGNEAFWDWVAQHGYGVDDFLILVDSRRRDRRFAEKGLINQPGMKAQYDPGKTILGLYIDQVDDNQVLFGQPAITSLPQNGSSEGCAPFKPGDAELYKRVVSQLPRDGLNPIVYGYLSGVLGLRLMPNPNFFGDTKDAEAARNYWNERVEKTGGAYYGDPKINADPKLVRPFRVSMSCAFCHVSPHPLNPPADPEKPGWENLSSTIGNQYWRANATFGNLTRPDSLLHQYLASQQPGTVDPSMVSTDHIDNPNSIIAIFDVPARLKRADENKPEWQGPANLLIPNRGVDGLDANPRHVPRAIVDGADSVGLFGSLSRVYLNIGAYSEEWRRVQNTLIGFRPQSPFSIASALKDSVYWRTGDKYRIPYLVSFFTFRNAETGATVTQPMHLADTREGKPIIDAEHDKATRGRDVFLANCAICHSSKQPDNFRLKFAPNWQQGQPTDRVSPPTLTLPMDFADWEGFVRSQPYVDYVDQIKKKADLSTASGASFFKDNFLSTDIRVPVTLVGTNSARAVSTNGMRGQVWDNFSSETYKHLPAVGEIRFYNPFSGKPVDSWGNNDSYTPPGGGPGYYRPPSLISLWATGPYLHDNSLGRFTGDPSINGRLQAFDDGIDKLLWNSRRSNGEYPHAGDLRADKELTGGDPGFIYRTTQTSWIAFPARFIRPLFEGIIGSCWVSFLSWYLWVGLGLALILLLFVARGRHGGFLLALSAFASGAFLYLSGIGAIYHALWLIPIVAALGALLLWTFLQGVWPGRIVVFAFLVLTAVAGWHVHYFIEGEEGDLRVGPIPKGTPISLLMNVNPAASTGDLAEAAFGITRGILRINKKGLTDDRAWWAFSKEAAIPLMRASKCPDFVLDRGHWFAESLTDDDKKDLKAFLKTL